MAEFFYYKKQQLKRTTAMTTILSLTGNFVTTKITNIVSILAGGSYYSQPIKNRRIVTTLGNA